MARPFGQVEAPVRMVSASSFQKKVGLKISMNGSWAISTGGWAGCAPDGAAEPARQRAAISNVPVDFMMPLFRGSLFSRPEPVVAGSCSQEADGRDRLAAAKDVGNPAYRLTIA